MVGLNGLPRNGEQTSVGAGRQRKGGQGCKNNCKYSGRMHTHTHTRRKLTSVESPALTCVDGSKHQEAASFDFPEYFLEYICTLGAPRAEGSQP